MTLEERYRYLEDRGWEPSKLTDAWQKVMSTKGCHSIRLLSEVCIRTFKNDGAFKAVVDDLELEIAADLVMELDRHEARLN